MKTLGAYVQSSCTGPPVCNNRGCVICSSQSMAVRGSGNSMMVHNSGPSMSVAHAGGGANMVGPLQDKLNKLLLNANSPAKSAGHGSLIAAGRYDNLSASLSQSVKVRCLMMQVHYPMLVASPDATWHLQASACILVVSETIRNAGLLVQRQNKVREQFMDAICCSLAHIGCNTYWLGCCAL